MTDPRAWRVIAASVAGTSHEKIGLECQDAHHWQILPASIVIAAVADGAGSAARGRTGAWIAARAAVEALAADMRVPDDEAGWRQRLTAAVRTARSCVEEASAEHGVSAREMATTLIVLVAAPQCVAVVQIGDGATVVRDGAGSLHALTRPPDDGYVNETTFLTDGHALESAQFRIWRGDAAQIAAFSDGLQRLALRLPAGVPHRPFFTPLFRFISEMRDEAQAREQLETFLRSPRITERTDDDLTLLLAATAS